MASIIGGKGPWTMAQWQKTYGKIYKIQLVDTFSVVLSDPDTIARITRKTGAQCVVVEATFGCERSCYVCEEDGGRAAS